MQFSIEKSIEILERTPRVLQALLHGISDEWIYQNEGEDTWSPFDVLGHLIYAERVNWLQRATIILSSSSDKTFPTFDRFAQFEESKGKTIAHMLEEFAQYRHENINQLRSLNLNNDALNKTGIHPTFGEVSLAQLLSTWVVHDLGHTAQINRVMAKQYKDAVGPWINFLRILQ